MRIQWYRPFPHPVEQPLAAAIPRPGDELVVQSLRPTSEVVATRAYHTVRDLPRVVPPDHTAVERLASQVYVYGRRVVKRRALVNHFAPDVVHVHRINMFTDWRDFQWLRKRAALVASVHDVVPHKHILDERRERRLLEACYRRADRLIVAHDTLKSQLVDEFGVDADRITVVPLGIAPVNSVAQRTKGPRVKVLFFGTIRPNKGLAILHQAWRELPPGTEVHLVVAGKPWPGEDETAQSFADEFDNVTVELRGIPTQRKHELFASADLVVLPYYSFAAQSGVLRDAYAFGVPAIVTDVGALGDTVRADGSGWVVPVGDPAALAHAIAQAANDSAARVRAGAAAARAGEDQGVQAVAESLRQVYDDVTRFGAAL
jgi:glycosyltransferase involved in cell wall biosynthesis